MFAILAKALTVTCGRVKIIIYALVAQWTERLVAVQEVAVSITAEGTSG